MWVTSHTLPLFTGEAQIVYGTGPSTPPVAELEFNWSLLIPGQGTGDHGEVSAGGILESDRPECESQDCQRSGHTNVAVTERGCGAGPQIEMRLEERIQSLEIDPHQIQEDSSLTK